MTKFELPSANREGMERFQRFSRKKRTYLTTTKKSGYTGYGIYITNNQPKMLCNEVEIVVPLKRRRGAEPPGGVDKDISSSL